MKKDLSTRKMQWYKKIKSVITSCQNAPQVITTNKLITMFGDRYDDDHMKRQLSEMLLHRSSKI